MGPTTKTIDGGSIPLHEDEMTKQHFIKIADAIREHNSKLSTKDTPFTSEHLATLADTFKRINPNFKSDRWLDYIAGNCGPNGGKR